MKILLVGAGGNLGTAFRRVLAETKHEVIAPNRKAFDIGEILKCRAFLKNVRPDAVINCAAWNDVDGAEWPESASMIRLLNVDGPFWLGAAAQHVGAKFIHFSTDYVMSGVGEPPFDEKTRPWPISAYGESKMCGEDLVSSLHSSAYIVRVAKLFGPKGTSNSSKPGFLHTMWRLAPGKHHLPILDDERGTPTSSIDAARMTLELLQGGWDPGTYHFVNEGEPVTWYGFAQELFRTLRMPMAPEPLTQEAFDERFGIRPAKRPSDSSLKNTKFLRFRSREEALRDFVKNDL